MLSALDLFYAKQAEPARSCLLTLQTIILGLDENITATWKWRMPVFCYKGKMFCYLRTDKKTGEPYIGIVEGKRIEHPLLEQGNRSRMKVLRVNSREDLQVEMIEGLLNRFLEFYRDGTVRVS